MRFLGRVGLGGRLLAILLFVVTIDFFVNSIFFDRASDFVLREDDAERMAEHLVIAQRIVERTPVAEREVVAREMSTDRFAMNWARDYARPVHAIELGTLRQQIMAFEPELDQADLHLQLMPLANGGNITGALRLPDRSVIQFRTFGRAAWSLNLGRMVGLALPSLLLFLLAWLLFRATLKPLRTLVRATSEVGAANPKAIEETGQAEVRHLIRAFNAMQERIHQLLASGSQTLLAIGHDLRTPLSRLRLRIEDAAIEPQLRDEINHDIEEMLELLRSLQAYVETGSDGMPAERIDIAATLQTIVDSARDSGAHASYRGPDHLEISARPVWIRRAVSNLVENAIAYGGVARVDLRRNDGTVEIVVEDEGPGIPEDRMAEVLRPFIRLDDARARNTAGMGLGLPIVDRAVKAEGGTLDLTNKTTGGLRATIRLPAALG